MRIPHEDDHVGEHPRMRDLSRLQKQGGFYKGKEKERIQRQAETAQQAKCAEEAHPPAQRQGDTWATFTYGADKLPPDEKAAHKFFRNYLRRLDYRMKREAWGELKYIFVTEYLDDGKKIRVHHHCVMNFPDRDLAEKMWTGGARTHTRRLQPDEAGLEGLGRYITKGKEFLVKHARMWSASRNLKQPKVTVSDTAVSRRRAQRMGTDYAEAETFFQRCNPAYRMTFQEVKFSDDVAGVYLYARFVLREGRENGIRQGDQLLKVKRKISKM